MKSKEIKMSKQERFIQFDNVLNEAICELLGDIPSDITSEDVDRYLERTDLNVLMKGRIVENNNINIAEELIRYEEKQL